MHRLSSDWRWFFQPAQESFYDGEGNRCNILLMSDKTIEIIRF